MDGIIKIQTMQLSRYSHCFVTVYQNFKALKKQDFELSQANEGTTHFKSGHIKSVMLLFVYY